MKEIKSPKLNAVLTWLQRHFRTVLILGIFIAFISILMFRGEGFFGAVQGSFLLLSYFLGYSGNQSDGSSFAPIAVIILLVLVGVAIYSFVKYKSKR
jgi:hypothetical protein